MKRKVTEWTQIQTELGDSRDEVALEQHIENKTFGKVWSQSVAIGLSKKHEKLVLAAETRYKDKHPDGR